MATFHPGDSGVIEDDNNYVYLKVRAMSTMMVMVMMARMMTWDTRREVI